MRFSELQEYTYKAYTPILMLEAVLPTPTRRLVSRAVGFLAVLFFVPFLLSYLPAFGVDAPLPGIFSDFSEKWFGAFLIVFSLHIFFLSLEWFRRSYYYRGLETVLERLEERKGSAMSFEVASIVYSTVPGDITGGLTHSYFGRIIFSRLALLEEDTHTFLHTPNRVRVIAEEFSVPSTKAITISRYAEAVYESDKALQQFLFERDIRKEEFVGAALWVEEMFRERRLRQRWWGRDNLGRLPALGRSLSYGQTYTLEKYARSIYQDASYAGSAFAWREREEVDALEAILTRQRQANALLVGEQGIGDMEIIARVARRIKEGEALPALMNKQVFVLDTLSLIAEGKETGNLEAGFARALSQAARAGNIILVVQNLASFIDASHAMGVDAIDILSPYFSAPELQIIFTSDPGRFHHTLSKNGYLMQFVEVIHIADLSGEMLFRVLAREALNLEFIYRGVFFSYQAIKEVATSGERYFPNAVMPDKGFDLLRECAVSAHTKGGHGITADDVRALVEQKTGVPTGAPEKEERETLLSLEKLLSERIVGQKEAIAGVAQAMRRARAGVRNMERPMGSFLFLGPTGVGKTETTKALAEVFFGDRELIMRLDMSEYSGHDALDRLIGSFQTGQAGALASMLREKQYGILLLDEFEKTSPAVHDLFLQILDEGQFTDVGGKRVNARNVIIIATSNAASDKIWEYTKEGANPANESRALTDEIISRKIFKPELLNRFDGVIVFHPLSKEDIRAIAGLMLKKLTRRLREEGINLEVSESLLDEVVEYGYDPQFGARPMNRAIQEHVEQRVADMLLRGDIQKGKTVRL